MNQYQIAIIMLLISQGVTLALLAKAIDRAATWRSMWLRDTSELLYWKRNAVLRDPNTGKYVKKANRT